MPEDVLAALQRVVSLEPFLVVAAWMILPAPGTLTRVVNTIDDLVTLALALVTVNRLEGSEPPPEPPPPEPPPPEPPPPDPGAGVTLFEAAEAAVCQLCRFACALNV